MLNTEVSSPLKNQLFFLDWDSTSILKLDPLTRHHSTVINNLGGYPDGILLDEENELIYWTNMGADWNGPDGAIEVARLDGSQRRMLVGGGVITTPKQIVFNADKSWLYFCDREGGRVMRCRPDGTALTTLVQRAPKMPEPRDFVDQCVGIAVDDANGKIYWSQKGPSKGNQGAIFRANIEIPQGQNAINRTDIETLLSALPEPIDLEIDFANATLYWSDRGAEPKGNTLNKARITAQGLEDHQIVAGGFKEAIGLDLDLANQQAFVSDLTGHVYQVSLATGQHQLLYQQGRLTGIKRHR